MEQARVLRVMSSHIVHLELLSGAVVCAHLSEPVSSSLGLDAACALRPLPVEVELGPYVTKDRRFTECKLGAVVTQPASGKTTKFRRIQK
jgi:hypothetical protein